MSSRSHIAVVAIALSACVQKPPSPPPPAPAPEPMVTVVPRREEAAPKGNHAPTLKPLAAIAAPSEPSTPAESAAARPTWTDAESYAPQFSSVALIPTEGSAPTSLDRRFLVCVLGVSYTAKYTTLDFGFRHTFLVGTKTETREAALRVVVDVLKAGTRKPAPGAHSIVAQTYKQGSHLVLGVPLAVAAAGDVLSFRVSDGPSKQITTLQITVGKGTLEGRSANGGVECRTAANADLERTLATALTELDERLAELDRDLLPGKSEFDSLRAAKTEDAFRDVAALVGWADPRIAARLEQLKELIARFESENREAIASANLPSRGTDRDLTYEALGAVCETTGTPTPTTPPEVARAFATRAAWHGKDHRPGCVITVKVTNNGPNRAFVGGLTLRDAIGKTYLVQQAGILGPKGLRTDEYAIAAGSEVTVLLITWPFRPLLTAFWRPVTQVEAPLLLTTKTMKLRVP